MYSCTDFNWSTDAPSTEHFEFTVTPGPKCLPNGDKQIDYFRFLVTNELLDILAEGTNIYAVEMFLNTVCDKARTSGRVNSMGARQ
jgi:hypothetical protein